MDFQKWKLIFNEFNDYQEFLILHSEILKKRKLKLFAHIFTLKFVHILEIFFVYMHLNKNKIIEKSF